MKDYETFLQSGKVFKYMLKENSHEQKLAN
jgi:hypothetical protein